jgi:hypothetical protein
LEVGVVVEQRLALFVAQPRELLQAALRKSAGL